MMNWKSTAVVSGAGLIATWLGVVSNPTSTPSPAATVAPAAQRLPAFARPSDIEQQAERLQMGIRAHTEFHPPSRNPFRFSERPTPHVIASTPVALVPPAAPVEPPRPTLRLIGIAADTVDGVMQRTAVFSTASDVQLIKEGESVAGYTVKQIDEDGVDVAAPDQTSLRLTFTP